jgi:membrane-bound ClpP family serine protease
MATLAIIILAETGLVEGAILGIAGAVAGIFGFHVVTRPRKPSR